MGNNEREVCALHCVLEDLLGKLDSRTENLPIILSTLESLEKIIKGNGRGSLMERFALLERDVAEINGEKLDSRVQRLEDSLTLFIKNVEKMKLEDTIADVKNLTNFYNNTKKFFFRISIPLVATAIIGIIGLFLNFWIFVQQG